MTRREHDEMHLLSCGRRDGDRNLQNKQFKRVGNIENLNCVVAKSLNTESYNRHPGNKCSERAAFACHPTSSHCPRLLKECD